MIRFTNEELFMMRIYKTGSRRGTFFEICGLGEYLDDDAEVMDTVCSVLGKLLLISDDEFRALDLEMAELI